MSRPPVDVARVGPDDLDEVLDLWSVARQETARGNRASAAQPREAKDRLIAALQAEEFQMVIARWAGNPAGYALMRVLPSAPLLDGSVLEVDHLFVLPQLRRHGIARALLMAVAGIAERHGADQILTSAPPGARDTHRYLARLGFSQVLVRRAVSTTVLRRRLTGESRRSGLEDLLSRRRSLRARAGRNPEGTSSADQPQIPVQNHQMDPAHTLEIPLVTDTDLVGDTSSS
jgi:GNAT superfamily N-acetyltransferase